MTVRRITSPNVGRVAVSANELTILVQRLQLFTNILSQTVFVVALGARSDRNVWLQPAQRAGFRDVDMTSGAFSDVLFACVAKLHRQTDGRVHVEMWSRAELVTAGAVFASRLPRFPVATEARRVTRWNRPKSCRVGNKRVDPAWQRLDRCSGPRPMTDFTVVVVLRLVVSSEI